jgi:hypothetical protein
LIVWDLPLTAIVKLWVIAFSSLNQIMGARGLRPTAPPRMRLAPTLAGQRLVPQTGLGNARGDKIDVMIPGIRVRSET